MSDHPVGRELLLDRIERLKRHLRLAEKEIAAAYRREMDVRSELAAAVERAERAEAALAALDGLPELADKLSAERDALRAEVDRLSDCSLCRKGVCSKHQPINGRMVVALRRVEGSPCSCPRPPQMGSAWLPPGGHALECHVAIARAALER